MASAIYPSRARIAFDGVSLDALTSTASATAEAAAASATFTLTFTLTEPLTWDGTNISDEDRAVIDAGVDACLSASAFCAKWPRVNEAADLLVFVATGGWTRAELHRHIASYLPSATTKGLAWLNSETVTVSLRASFGERRPSGACGGVRTRDATKRCRRGGDDQPGRGTSGRGQASNCGTARTVDPS